MNIIEITEYSDEVHKAINELLPQLIESAVLLSVADLQEIIQSESSHLLMAEEDGQYYGSLTLAVITIPTGSKAWVEDVVVNKSARGKGVGRLLCEHAVTLSKKLGIQTMDLTSRPTRKTANSLYKRVGFKLRETNVYRRDIT